MNNVQMTSFDEQWTVPGQQYWAGEVGKIKLLLMDDSSFDREAISRLSERSMYDLDLVETASIAETRAVLRDQRPDVAFLDYRVPDGDGIEYSREIARELGDDAPPIVVVTGEGDETTSYVGKIWLLRSAGHGTSVAPDALLRLPRRALPSRNDLFHSKHRVRALAALTVLNTRSQIPSRRPEHYLRGQQAASTAHQREVLPPGLTPSKKGR